MNKIVNVVKKPVVWISAMVAAAIGVAVGLLVKFKDKIIKG